MSARPDEPSAALEIPGCRIRTVGFDFGRKHTAAVPLEDRGRAAAAGMFLWHDIEILDAPVARGELERLGLFDASLLARCFEKNQSARYARYEEGLHIAMTGCRLVERDLALERVDVVVDAGTLVTLHAGAPLFLQRMHREYARDFARYAQTSTFLVFELFDHLIENYVEVQRRLEDRVESLQRRVTTEFDDSLFVEVSSLGAELLHFRRLLMPARAVLSELSTRRNVYINEAAQPYLAKMADAVDHVLHDVLVGRDILTEAVSLHMSIMAHRTNETVKRLTVVSVIFLPLTFLCGVYGMNLAMPEHHWDWGYPFFWGLVALITLVLIVLMRRQKLL